MESFPSLVVTGTIIFAATNIDDLFVLLGFFADAKFSTLEIVLGQYTGIAALIFFSLVGSIISLAIPHSYIGLLGLLPITIGVRRLAKLWEGDKKTSLRAQIKVSGHSKSGTVALVTIAGGGDNIAIYTPVFATHSLLQTVFLIVVFSVLTAAWCFIAHLLVHHRALGAVIRRYGHRMFPWVLIILGFHILISTVPLQLPLLK